MLPLIERLPQVRGSYRKNANLSKTNWFNVGGLAEVVFRPADTEDLSFFLQNKPLDTPVTVIGVGSNLLVRDGGINGVVIKLGRGFTKTTRNDHTITAGAGSLDYNIAIFSKEQGLSGLEFLSGVPGTIGGALAMNAGAYGSDISGTLITAEAVDEGGNILLVPKEDFGFVYRGNTLPDGLIFTNAEFACTPAPKEEIARRIDEITRKRSSTQPIKSRTSGSTFKNPIEGKKAWELIDAAGCRGLQIGDAQVSELHCNFLINLGKATASDIENLGEEIRKRVKEDSGIDLQWEIQIIGNK
jgi:UDP-N-acetylmuramate dehydrogenase